MSSPFLPSLLLLAMLGMSIFQLAAIVSIQDCAGAYGPCAGALLISILQTMCSGALQLEIPQTWCLGLIGLTTHIPWTICLEPDHPSVAICTVIIIVENALLLGEAASHFIIIPIY